MSSSSKNLNWGGKREGAGLKPGQGRKASPFGNLDKKIMFRTTDELHDRVGSAAKLVDINVSEFYRLAAKDWADKILRERKTEIINQFRSLTL